MLGTLFYNFSIGTEQIKGTEEIHMKYIMFFFLHHANVTQNLFHLVSAASNVLLN